jgi:hypothetical protein
MAPKAEPVCIIAKNTLQAPHPDPLPGHTATIAVVGSRLRARVVNVFLAFAGSEVAPAVDLDCFQTAFGAFNAHKDFDMFAGWGSHRGGTPPVCYFSANYVSAGHYPAKNVTQSAVTT